MSDPTMPAALAEILSEPGWDKRDGGYVLERNPGIGRAFVAVREVDGIWWSALATVGAAILTYDEVAAFAHVMRRIEVVISELEEQADMAYLLGDEAALAQEDPA